MSKLVVYHSSDKEGFEKEGLQPGFSHPARILVCGVPSSGKSSVVLNILLHHYLKGKSFERIICIHYLAGITSEYESVDDIEMLDTVPESLHELLQLEEDEEIDKDALPKMCLILEDIDIGSLNKQQRSFLDRCYGVLSSHLNMTVICCVQQPISAPPSLRRMISHAIVFKYPNIEDLRLIAQKFGLTTKQISGIFAHVCNKPHDSLCIAMDSKWRLRRNLYEHIPENT